MGLKRAQVYICNVLKCRPPANRNPHKDEIATCSPFLQHQLQIIKPEVIVALGTFAAQTLLDTKEPISRMRGQFHSWHGIPVMPTFHPSFCCATGEQAALLGCLERYGTSVTPSLSCRSGEEKKNIIVQIHLRATKCADLPAPAGQLLTALLFQ